MFAVIHSDEVVEETIQEVDLAFRRRRLGRSARMRRIGLSHYLVAPGSRQMPVHVHGDEEEIFYVLRGRGIGYEINADPYPVAAGDTIVHRPNRRPHTFLAAADAELELLAFGSGSDSNTSFLPRAGVMWVGPRWVPLDAPHPWRAEALAGPLARPETLGTRPAHVATLGDVEPTTAGDRTIRRLGAAAGAALSGLNHVTMAPGGRSTPHCHSLEEEAFYVLDGSGTVVVGEETHPLRAGDVVARPPGTGVCHHLTAGEDGLSYLAYGTREPGDSVYLPQRGEVRLRGLGVSIRVAE